MIKYTENQFKECIAHVSSTPEGKIVLAYLKDYCRYGKDIAHTDPNIVQANATLQRAWLKLRSYIKPTTLAEIEIFYEKEEIKNAKKEKSKNKSYSK